MKKYIVGLISDTHGLLRTEIFKIFDGCDLIVHAGDIGKIDIVKSLEKIAPVLAVRGNCDWGKTAIKFPQTNAAELGGKAIYVIHDIDRLDISFQSDFDVIIYGHSHKPLITRKANKLLINPGSAGPRRFNLPVSVGKLYIAGEQIDGEIIELKNV